MQVRLPVLLAPIAVAGAMFLAGPQAARAADTSPVSGSTTYEVVPAGSLIRVTIQLTIGNANAGYATVVQVEPEASGLSITSNAGPFTQTLVASNNRLRAVQVQFPYAYYGQTRTVTAAYSLPAGIHAPGGYRAGQAYASLCALGSGSSSGSVSIVVPSAYALRALDGGKLTATTASGGKQAFSSGTVTPGSDFWTCVEAVNPANLTHTALTAGGQQFDLASWPEDTAWVGAVAADVSGDAARLQEITGLSMPGGTINILETGGRQLGGIGLGYDPSSSSVRIPDSPTASQVASGLSRLWFNSTSLQDAWAIEGLSGYAAKAAGQGNYKPCGEPGVYPGTGAPNLMSWPRLTSASAPSQVNILDWQRAAACYFFTTLVNMMGPGNFRDVMKAIAADQMAYQGATPGESLAGAARPYSSEALLDLLDERGMIPAGVKDLDTAQNLLSSYGVFDAATLSARSSTRAAYHALATAAGTWKLPLATRAPMSTWDFVPAQTATATAKTVIDIRDTMESQISSFSLDDTEMQTRFESAASSADLDTLLVLMTRESAAAVKIEEATRARNGSHNILQIVGLLGADLDGTLRQAQEDLAAVRPDDAEARAQSVIDSVNGANGQGLLRSAGTVGVLGVLLIGLDRLRKRRARLTAAAAGEAATAARVEGVVAATEAAKAAAPEAAKAAVENPAAWLEIDQPTYQLMR